MGEWIGEMGGFTAVALVAALGCRFLHEIGVLKNAELLRSRARTALFVLLAGIGYMTLGGLYYKFFRADVSAWNIQAVWGLTDVTMYLGFAATIAGALLLEGCVPSGARVVLLPFAFYLFVQPIASFGFCTVCVLVYAPLKKRTLPPLNYNPPWLLPALCVIDAFVLFICL